MAGRSTRVEIHCAVLFADGRRVRGATVTLRRLALGERMLSATTDAKGKCSFSWDFRGNLLNAWTMVQRVEVSARLTDRQRGVTFSAGPQTFIRSQGGRDWGPSTPLVIGIGRVRVPDPGTADVRLDVLENLESLANGEEVAWSIAEMVGSLQSNLPTAAVCMAGRVVGQAIWLKGQGGWWDPAWDSERPTLGPLLDKPPVRSAIESATTPGYYARLRRSFLLLRNDASHGIDTPISMNEARTCVDLARQLVEAWWAGTSTQSV